MPGQDVLQYRRPSRKITKHRREPGRISMDIPERFRYASDGEVEEEEEEDMSKKDMALMHQSIFGMIAAAHSKDDFHPALEESGSESEGDEHIPGAVQEISQKAQGKMVQATGPSDTKKHHKKLSDHRLLRSLPGLRTKHGKDQKTRGITDRHNPPTGAPPPKSSPLASPPSPVSRDAPIMSQMLQARAKAEEIDSSGSTLKASKGRLHSPSGSQSSRKAAPNLPQALKEIFQFDEPEEVISGINIQLHACPAGLMMSQSMRVGSCKACFSKASCTSLNVTFASMPIFRRTM